MRKKATHATQEQKGAVASSYPSKSYKRPERTSPRSEGKVHVAVSQPPTLPDPPQPRNKGKPSRGSPSSCKNQCTVRSSYHYVFSCRQFLDMSVQQRKVHVQSSSHCSNCLRPGHTLQDCKCGFRCRLCKGEHNTLLHSDSSSSSPSGSHTGVVNVAVGAPTNPQKEEKLLMTSQVLLTGPSGKQLVVRALLDTGADTSIISNKVMNTLQLKKLDQWVTLTGVEGPHQSPARPTAQVNISSPFRKDWSKTVTVAAVSKVTNDLPRQDAHAVRQMPHIRDLELADPYFHEPRRVDLILDVDFLDSILLPDRVKGPPGTPTAWNTELGWGIMGRYVPDQGLNSSTAAVHTLTQEAADTRLSDALEKFWKMEELPKGTSILSPEETQVQQHYATTHLFSPPAGRYVVTLPRRESTLQLGESRSKALNRYLRNEQSLLKKGTWTQFQAVVQEYLSLGHAQPVTPQEMCTPVQQSYYLPMHAVYKASSSSTKLRVVFDASCPTSTGVALNHILAAGPTLHPNLDKILIRFRSYRVALSGDIGKMYREVLLSEPDRQLHRFLWRSHPDQPIHDYCMNRVTFGVTSSPYVAVRTLQQTAMDFSPASSLASWHVCQSFYVDDLFAGADSVPLAMQLFKDLRDVLSKGGFDLRKWRSSSAEVLKQIPSELQEKLPSQELVDNHTAAYPKALGITWDSNLDCMSTHVQLPDKFVSTKRGIVSDTARAFDVLGWVAPVILQMKVLFQKLWQLKVGWDEELPEELRLQHEQWRAELPLLRDIQLPRCYFLAAPSVSVQLHGFSDASSAAYAAVVYLRATYEDGSITCRLVVAKTRVAPLKQLSIPKLELCGAAMLAELLAITRETLQVPNTQIHAWCDSTVALA